MQAQGLLGCSAESFARARSTAESLCRRNRHGAEVTLDEIYGELAHSLMLDQGLAEALKRHELDLEGELIRPVLPIAARVDRAPGARSAALCILRICTSSQKQLSRGSPVPGSGVRATGSTSPPNATRRRLRDNYSGRCSEPRAPRDMRCATSGIIPGPMCGPRSAGLIAKSFEEGNLNRYEEILESQRWATEGFSSFLAGASRLARLSVEAADPREQALRGMAAGVMGPTLVGYVLWILRRTLQLGLERLYFISRDGQVLLEIAHVLADRLGLEACELRYLYGSRQAWLLPALREIGAAERAWILAPTGFLSVESLLARVGIEPAEAHALLSGVGLGAESEWRRSLSAAELESIAVLLDDESFQRMIREKAEAARADLVPYLRQERLLDGARTGVVDLGWRGSLQDSLTRLINDAGGTAPHGFYFGLRESPYARGADGPREAYFFDEPREQGFWLLGGRLIYLLEAFCSADHGRVVGYEECRGVMVPRFDESARGRSWAGGCP